MRYDQLRAAGVLICMERILIVEDDNFFRTLLTDLLKGEGYEVDSAANSRQALQLFKKNVYQLVVTDLVLPDKSGLDLLTRVKQHDPNVDVIIITGHANVETAITALKSGARDYLIKPFNYDEFKHTVALCMEQRRLIDENIELKELLNIYQVGQNIANCLDLERLHELVVDSLAKEVGVTRGFGLFLTAEGELEPSEYRGVSEEEAKALSMHLRPDILKYGNGSHHLKGFPQPLPDDLALCEGLKEGIIFFISSKNAVQGVVVLLNDPGSALPQNTNSKTLNFILDQASLAFENAARYTTVKNLLYVDELTGLNNYRYLDIALEREIKRAERNGTSVSVLFLDLDLFKNVNDVYGHLVGSRVLREVGALLKQSVREVDTVVRYGGDEYTVILGETGLTGSAIVAERIRKSIETHHFLAEDGYDIRITASLGYSCYPEDTRSKLELLEMADQAMYYGKSVGKNVVYPAVILRQQG